MTGIARRRVLALVVALSALGAALPGGAAAADDQWTQAPGVIGDDAAFAARFGTGFLAATDDAQLHVSYFNDRTGAVGGTVAHALGHAEFEPSLAVAGDGNPWVTWVELDSSGTREVRVARFAAGTWHEVGGGVRPITPSGHSALEPQIVSTSTAPTSPTCARITSAPIPTGSYAATSTSSP